MVSGVSKTMKDKCTLCWEETQYDRSESIHNREHYIEGSGQLCDKCYDETYAKH